MRDAPTISVRRHAASSSRLPPSTSCGLLYEDPDHQLRELDAEVRALRGGERSLARGVVDRIGGRGSVKLINEGGERRARSIAAADHGEAALQAIRLLDSSDLLGGLEAVGHRVVHGGARFSGPTLLDAGAEEAIEELAELAPLHNGPAL